MPIMVMAPVHVPPVWQTSPGQHAPPTAPQFMQVRPIPFAPAHARAVLHMPPQQIWPLAPHGSHVVAPPSPPPWHDSPASHASPPPPQHSAPRLPHATHIAPAQRAPDPVQVMTPPPIPPPLPPAPPAPPPSTAGEPPQQVWPTAPHTAPLAVMHDPFEQVPAVPAPMHADPLATHMPPTQQPPDWQVFAAQHARPGAPQLGAPMPPPVPGPPPSVLPPLLPHDATATASVAISAPTRK
jgi:hypothetical protein